MKKNYNDWSKEELIKEVEVLKKQKTYGLVWEKDKTKEIFDYYINWDGEKTKETFPEVDHKFPVLKEITNNEIITNLKKEFNILIEGNNYHSLAVLNFTHNKSIDIIYIDPPYNTGSGDFVYNDKLVDKEDGYRHSKWLSFMEKRLKLAKELLKKDGVIFISIDDNEVAQLKILCDEIFGEENFIEQIIWKNKYGAGAKTTGFISIHEYILCYSKGGIKDIQSPLGENEFKKHNKKDEHFDIRGGYRTQPLMTKSLGDRPNLVYPIKYKGQEIWPDKQWVWSKERMDKAIKNNWVEFTKKKDGTYGIRAKQYLMDETGTNRKGKPLSIIDNFFTQEGTKELEDLFGKSPFAFPKPKNLIKYLIGLYFNGMRNKEAIILDFFAGSGTTGHAVLDLNKEDGGNRKFILCTNNENNICTEVCYPRINKVIHGYTGKISNNKYEPLNENLKYFKTDFIESAPTDKNKKNIVDKSTEMICIKENAFSPVKKTKEWKIFKNNDYYIGIIFDDDYIEDFVKEAKKIEGKIHVYVFSLDESVPEKEFKELKNKVKLCPIPEVILHVYRRIFK